MMKKTFLLNLFCSTLFKVDKKRPSRSNFVYKLYEFKKKKYIKTHCAKLIYLRKLGFIKTTHLLEVNMKHNKIRPP